MPTLIGMAGRSVVLDFDTLSSIVLDIMRDCLLMEIVGYTKSGSIGRASHQDIELSTLFTAITIDVEARVVILTSIQVTARFVCHQSKFNREPVTAILVTFTGHNHTVLQHVMEAPPARSETLEFQSEFLSNHSCPQLLFFTSPRLVLIVDCKQARPDFACL
jgi:hypothetical protein